MSAVPADEPRAQASRIYRSHRVERVAPRGKEAGAHEARAEDAGRAALAVCAVDEHVALEVSRCAELRRAVNLVRRGRLAVPAW